MLIQFLSKVVRTITLSRVFMYSAALLVSLALYTVYENRARLFPSFVQPNQLNLVGASFKLGPETEGIIRDRVLSDKAVIAIGVLSADLRLNEARTIFFFADDISLSEVSKLMNSDGGYNRMPLFTNIDESNAEVIRLINGQFSCIKFQYTLLSRIHPELTSTVKMMCRSSIPSYYGYFSGFVSVLLNEEYTADKQAQLKLVTDKLATDLYFRDVLPTQRREKSERLLSITK